MKLFWMGVITIGFLSLFNCKTIYHKLTTGDHNATGKDALITLERIQSIRPGVTSSDELDGIFDGIRSSKWTYRKPFWLTWEGQKYRIDKAMAYKQDIIFEPRSLDSGAVLHAWKELRFVRAYLYKGIVQFYIVAHKTRNEEFKAVDGSWQNYDVLELKFGSSSGLACERLIYDVVSLGAKLDRDDQEDFDKYCRALVIEEGE